MMRPPISAERLASLPPEMRAILVEVIDYYESRLATLQKRVDQLVTENAALKSELVGVRKAKQNSSLPTSTQHSHAKPVVPEKKVVSKLASLCTTSISG